MKLAAGFRTMLSRCFSRSFLTAATLGSSIVFSSLVVVAQDKVEPEQPKIAEASDEAEQAISSFTIPTGWKMEVFAAEPDVANGVCLFVD